MRRLIPGLLILCLVHLPARALAQDEYETVVRAKGLAEDPLLSGRSVDTMDEDEIEESPGKSLPEVLEDAPGVFVQHTNYGGGSPILRGLIGPQVLILVDGVRFSNSVYRTGPVQYLNLIDQFSLDRIEILRGPGSVLHGSDAMGGVIQAFTLEAPDLRLSSSPWGGGDLLARYISACTGIVGHAHAGAGAGGLGVVAGATLKGFGNLTPGGGGEQIHSGYDAWSAMGNVTYRFSKGFLSGWSLKAVYLVSGIEDAGRTDKLYDKNSLSIYDNVDHLLYGRLHMLLSPIHTSGDLTVSFQHFFERKDTVRVGSDHTLWLGATRDGVTARTLGLDLALVTRVVGERLKLRYGGLWYRDHVGAFRLVRQPGGPWVATGEKSFPDGSTYDGFGAYLLAEGEVMRLRGVHVLRLDAGYRFHGMGAAAPSQGDLPSVDFTSLGHVALGSVQYVYDDIATLAFTFSQGFRAPNLAESVMLGDTGKFFHVPSDDLAPEKSNTFELLGRARLGALTAGCSVYVSLLEDLIKREQTAYEGRSEIGGKPVVHNVNGDRGTLFGVEAMMAVRFGLGFSLSGHLTYTWGEEQVEDGPDEPLTRIPPVFGLLGLRWDSPGYGLVSGFAETTLRFASKQFRLSSEDMSDVRIPEGGTPGWLTWNVRMGLTVREKYIVGIALENLLDARYRYHGSGLYAPGVNAVMTLEMHI
ncbi:MAG: TonB-dependent receptor [Deltaproteobacteria bacterium]|nr:TonB-dependent receptor [Deltaproteobacteria bacterium]